MYSLLCLHPNNDLLVPLQTNRPIKLCFSSATVFFYLFAGCRRAPLTVVFFVPHFVFPVRNGMAEGTNTNQFQLIPQVVPVFHPQQLPPPLQTAHFRMTGQPIFPVPAQHFGYPPVAWSPIHRYPTPQPVYNNHVDENDFDNVPQQQPAYNSNGYPVDNLQNEQHQSPRRPTRYPYTRNLSNKVKIYI